MTRRLPVLQWKRTGECNRCGACCRSGNAFGDDRPGPIAGACALYDEHDGVGICTDREDHYYQIGCAHWPSEPDHIRDYPECSYRFERA